MRIQQQNSYNPNMKALYFTKGVPVKAARGEVLKKDERLTDNGIKFLKDESAKLTPIIREAIAGTKFIKNLAKVKDVFVNYFGERFDTNFEHFTSSMAIYIESDKCKNDANFKYLPLYAKDKCTPEGARLRLFAKLEKDAPLDEI